MATTADMSRGLILKLEDSLYSVVEFGQNKTARAGAKIWAKLKGVDNARSIEHTWNSGDTIYPVRVEKKPYQFLYKDDSGYNFMDNETFDQIYLDKKLLGDSVNYIKEGVTLLIAIENGTSAITAEPPNNVVMEVQYTEPGLQGDTATRTLKPATLETGIEIRVPLFINTGDKIKIDARTGEYIERVK
jgi:elongation factor P